MFSEFPVSKVSERLVRAVMCLNSDEAPEGYFLTPAIRRSGIVVAVKNNVSIKTVENEFIPPQASFKGPYNIPYFFSYLGTSVTTFATDLHPIGLHEITKKSGAFFKNKYIDLKEVWPQEEITDLVKALSQEELTLRERARIFDQFVISKMSAEISEKSVIVETVDRLVKARAYKVSIDEIADELITSRKTLERVFKEVLGLSPKQYFSVCIFEDMIRAHVIQKENSMSDFLESPFYDFSHINKWFKKFTNTSPTNFASHDMNVMANILSPKI